MKIDMKMALKIFHSFSDVDDNQKFLVRLVHPHGFPYVQRDEIKTATNRILDRVSTRSVSHVQLILRYLDNNFN